MCSSKLIDKFDHFTWRTTRQERHTTLVAHGSGETDAQKHRQRSQASCIGEIRPRCTTIYDQRCVWPRSRLQITECRDLSCTHIARNVSCFKWKCPQRPSNDHVMAPMRNLSDRTNPLVSLRIRFTFPLSDTVHPVFRYSSVASRCLDLDALLFCNHVGLWSLFAYLPSTKSSP